MYKVKIGKLKVECTTRNVERALVAVEVAVEEKDALAVAVSKRKIIKKT